MKINLKIIQVVIGTVLYLVTNQYALAALTAPNLSAQVISQSQINLSWTDNNVGVKSYELQRSLQSSTGFAIIATVSGSIKSYNNTGLSANTVYYYKIRAIKNRIGPFSSTINAKTLATVTPPPPGVVLKTDYGVYPEPNLPIMGPAGSKVTDPTFGTQILRLTDAGSGTTSCTVTYSTIPAFNKNNTRAYVRCSPYSVAHFYAFDSVNFSAGARTNLVSPPSGMYQYWMLWSGINPDIIYGNNGYGIYSFNLATQSNTLIMNAEQHLLAGERLNWQMSRSEDDNIFADSFNSGTTENAGYVVWRRSDNRVLLKQYGSGINEVEIDKTGRYLAVNFDGGLERIWDLSTNTYIDAGGVYGFYHRGMGRGTVFTGANYQNLGFRSLSSPLNILKLLTDGVGMWSYAVQQDHFSLLADNEKWGLGSRYHINGLGVTKAFDNEIVQIATDGSKQVRRIAHHRSVFPTGGYTDAPMANISRDGQFIAFTSNWGNSGRRDVYIVRIPPAP
ncbi:MAG: fibronectin type III domain-containing protein [Pseudomonadota bacterium]|nr:fibronectin type III domain-containing protein [Pseudomonadota bacterium]